MKNIWLVLCLAFALGAEALASRPPPPAETVPPGYGSYRPMSRQQCERAGDMKYMCQQWGECCRYVRPSRPGRCKAGQGACTKNSDCCSGVCMAPLDGAEFGFCRY